MIRFVAAFIPALLLAGCMSQQPVPAVDRSTSAQSRAASSPQPTGPGYYTVKRGDTLYRIALEHGQDHRDIAAWNNLSNPSAIKEGQVLRVQPPVAAAAVTPESSEGVVAKPIATGPVVESRSLDQPSAPLGGSAQSSGVKREPKVGKEPYSDEAYARLNKTGEPAKASDAKPETKPEAPAATPAVAPGPDDVTWMWPSSAKVSVPYSEAGNKGLDFAGKAGDPVFAAADGKVSIAGSPLPGYGQLIIIMHANKFLSAYAHNQKLLVVEEQRVKRGQKIAEMGSSGTDSVKLHFEIRKQGKPVDPALYLPKR